MKVQLLAVGAEFVVAIEHQDVLDDKAVGLSVVLVFADLVSPGGCPVDQGQVLISTVDQLAPAGFIQAEDQVAVLLLVGGLDSSRVTGDDGVVVNADGEAGFLGLIDKPGGALGGVGVGVDADGVAGIILIRRKRGGAGNRKDHNQRQKQCESLFHLVFLLLFISVAKPWHIIPGYRDRTFCTK